MGGTATIPDRGDPFGDNSQAPPPAASAPPDAGPQQPDTGPQRGDPFGDNSWTQAAQSGQQAPQPQQPGTPAGTTAQSNQPVVLTPQKRGGILGLVDSMADVLAGRTRPELATDQQGNTYVKQQTLTRGEQWARVASEGIHGAAAGFAAGQGAGHMGSAALAGVQAGDKELQDRQQQETDLNNQARQKNLDMANHQMQQMQMAEKAWTMTHQQHVATQEDVEFAQKQIDRLIGEGGKVLGNAANPNDISGILKVQPDVMEQLVKNGRVRLMPNFDADGKSNGITALLMPDNHRNEMLPPGTPFTTFDPVSGGFKEQKVADWTSRGDIDGYTTAAQLAKMDFDSKKAALAKEAAQTAEANAAASKAPSEITKNRAEAGKDAAEGVEARAKANEANANAAKIRSDISDGLTPNLTDQAIVGGMLDGSVDITKAVGIFKDPHARERFIAAAKAQDPNWTMQKYQTMLKLREDLNSGKLGDQVQSFNAFLGHAANLDQAANTLRNSNLRLLNMPINALRNQTGNPTVAAVLPEIDATKNEFQTFITNHALQKSEIERGEKLLNENQSLAQMQASLKSFMQVALTRMGAIQYRTSQAFGAQSPQLISPQNVQAIQSLGLGAYANSYGLMPHTPQGAPQTQPTAPAATRPGAAPQPSPSAVRVTPGEPTARGSNGETLVVRNGAWVAAQQ